MEDMKKSGLISFAIVLSLCLLFSFSFVSASWFDDFLGKLTGEVVANTGSTCPYSFPSATIYDAENDQSIPQNDITSLNIKQISDSALQIKVSARGNPLDLRNSHYLVFFDSDSNKSTGRYTGNWDIGEDFSVRIGYDENGGRYFAGVENSKEGSLADLPVLIKDNSVYVIVPLIPYKDAYKFGNIIKFAIDVVNVPGEGDSVSDVGFLTLQQDITYPNSNLSSENTIFASSPHSIFLDYDKRDFPIALKLNTEIVSLENISYFSTKLEIAELVDGNSLKTNFDINNEQNNSDYSWISAYIPACDLMIDDSIKALSGNKILKYDRAAFIIPSDLKDPNSNSYFHYESVLKEYDVARISSLAVQIQEELMGRIPYTGKNRLFAFNYPACGWAGQPLWIGVGCFVLIDDFGTDKQVPRWGIYYHELGHEFLMYVFSNKFSGLYKEDWGKYGEGWATLNGMYTIHKLVENSSEYNLSGSTLESLKKEYVGFYGFVNATNCANNDQGCYTSLWAYENIFNNNFSKMDANIIDGIFIYLAENSSINPRGWEIYPRFYRAFLPEYWSKYDDVNDSLKGNTFFIAGLSAAAGNDLRYLFRDKWHFPIDDAYFDRIYPVLNSTLNEASCNLNTFRCSPKFNAVDECVEYDGKIQWVLKNYCSDNEICRDAVCYSNVTGDCKIEPTICPPHGYQTKTCKVWNEQTGKYETQTSQITCSPGLCDGCYVDDKCVIYGVRLIVKGVSSYCGVDGNIHAQKTKDDAGGWAICQNSYECDSNLCSSGECVEILDMTDYLDKFRVTGVKVVCKLTNLFSIEDYSQCLEGYL